MSKKNQYMKWKKKSLFSFYIKKIIIIIIIKKKVHENNANKYVYIMII